ncbi:MAG: phosphatase PAP2 family protein [Terrimicrobiaceae bacterium]
MCHNSRPSRVSLTLPTAVALAAALLAGTGCVAREASQPPVRSVAAGVWTVPDKAFFISRIGPPPAPGSAAERRDIDRVLELQAQATPQKIAAAQRTLDLTVFTFAKAIGPDFDPARFPQTSAFFRRLNDIVRATNDPLKAHFRRPHPFEADPRIRRLVDAPAQYSYPSYHGARCAVFWHTLALLDHHAADAFHAIALQVERQRVFAGEHFPSDIAAGRLEGRLIFAALERDPAFRADLEKLKRSEWTPAPRVRAPKDAVDFMTQSR